MPVNTFVLLRTEGVTAVLDLTDGRLPSIPYWGADLGELSESEVAAIARSSAFPTASNIVDDPVRLAVLPEHWTGWVGRPGLSGSRAGRDWSPKFTSTALRVDGEPVVSGRTTPRWSGPRGPTRRGRRRRRRGRARSARGHRADRRADWSGPGRRSPTRAPTPTSSTTACSPSRCPGSAREILDFAGRWGKERIAAAPPARRRHPPAGGPQGPYRSRSGDVLHVGAPGFGFADGRDLGRAHRLERQPHPLRRAAVHRRAGDRRRRAAAARRGRSWHRARPTPRPGSTASYGDGLDDVARRFHRFLRARPQHPVPRPDRSPSTSGRPSTSTTTWTGWSTWPSGRPRSASSATCSTTAGSARAATTTPGSATGRSRRTSGRTACIRWSTR